MMVKVAVFRSGSALIPKFLTLLLVSCILFGASGERLDGRYSFSLTTFDPDGKLGQVERATRAASLGTPVAAVKLVDGILLAAPQALPSPLVRDDGTARFCRITRNIAVAHSGLGADGRVVIAAAQRMAIEHAYTFDETIPIELFLEEVSLLFQEYTMKQAARPFGCTLLVAYVPDPEDDAREEGQPELYRIDPSGSVESVQKSVCIGSLTSGTFLSSLEEVAERKALSLEEGKTEMIELLKSHLQKNAGKIVGNKPDASLPFLSATLTTSSGLVVRRHVQPKESEKDMT